jgi:hypothetical protein
MSGGQLHMVDVYRPRSIAEPEQEGEEERDRFGREGAGGDDAGGATGTHKPVRVRRNLPVSIGLRSAMMRASAAGVESATDLGMTAESGVDVREGDYIVATSGPRSRSSFKVGRVWDWGMGFEADLSEAEIAIT